MENKKSILIVEDEEPIRSALRDKLKYAGYITSEARDGEEGLSLALKEHPDLILLDIVMPKMDGLTMLSELRKDFWGKHAMVIVLTNLEADNQRTLAVTKDEPSFYLVKADWKLEDLIEKIRKELL